MNDKLTYRISSVGAEWVVFITRPNSVSATASVLLTEAQFNMFNQWREYGGDLDELLLDLKPSEREALRHGIIREPA